jgi:hypothetical protein
MKCFYFASVIALVHCGPAGPAGPAASAAQATRSRHASQTPESVVGEGAQIQCSGTESFDPKVGLPTLPAVLAVQEPDNFFVQFYDALKKADTEAFRAKGLSLEHYFMGYTYVEHMNPQVVESVRTDARVRSVLAIPVACKLSKVDIDRALGPQRASRPPYPFRLRMFEKNNAAVAERIQAAGFAPAKFFLGEGSGVVTVQRYEDLVRLAAIAGVQWLEVSVPITAD